MGKPMMEDELKRQAQAIYDALRELSVYAVSMLKTADGHREKAEGALVQRRTCETSLSDCFGSLAAGRHLRPSTSAFEHKADIPADGIISLGTAATGH